MAPTDLRLVVLYLCFETFCYCYEPITSAVGYFGTAVLVSFVAYNPFKCNFNECCNKPWINYNMSSLKESFKNDLYGQHLAEFTILKSLQGYLNNENPKKALVMSFHGHTGSGKNYVSSMIAKSLYKKGLNSAYFHLYIANKDFPHKEKVSLYQDKLRNDITHFTKLCERNMFVFDEIDKMPPGTLDAIKPYLDYHEHIDNVDYRKNIFIFLSNSGSYSIEKIALRFWADGREREDITMKDIEPIISKGAFNENGGLQYSELLSSELVDMYVPFLPLEKKHVKQCIAAELKNQNIPNSQNIINKIADQLLYFPKEAELYSKSGCKKILPKIDAFRDV